LPFSHLGLGFVVISLDWRGNWFFFFFLLLKARATCEARVTLTAGGASRQTDQQKFWALPLPTKLGLGLLVI
jgi:hypothetical protein